MMTIINVATATAIAKNSERNGSDVRSRLAAKPAVVKPERSAPPNATAATTGKPPEPPHANQPALRPVERAAPPPNATAAVGKSEPTPAPASAASAPTAAPPASKPSASRTPQTGVAKPVERPLSATDGHMR